MNNNNRGKYKNWSEPVKIGDKGTKWYHEN
jgi:hypothetical protein